MFAVAAAGPFQKDQRQPKIATPTEITHPAHVLPYEQTDVFARLSGYLQAIHVDLGDAVKEGQEIAVLSLPELAEEEKVRAALEKQAAADLAQTKAALTVAGAQVAMSKAKQREIEKDLVRLNAEKDVRLSELDRFARLYKDGTVQRDQWEEKQKLYLAAGSALESGQAAVETAKSKVLVEAASKGKAEADVDAAQARVDVAKAKLEETKTMAEYATIRAPFAGIVTRRLVHKGAFIQSAAASKTEPLVTIVRVDRLRIVTDIPAADAPAVRIGQPATLQIPGLKEKLPGTVQRLAGVLDSSTRTLRVEIELKSIPNELRPGMFGYVSISIR